MRIPLNSDCLTFKVESSAFAFVCLEISNLLKLEISTLLKLENSCLLLFSEGLKFQALEGLKSNVKTHDSSFRQFFSMVIKRGNCASIFGAVYLIGNLKTFFNVISPGEEKS